MLFSVYYIELCAHCLSICYLLYDFTSCPKATHLVSYRISTIIELLFIKAFLRVFNVFFPCFWRFLGHKLKKSPCVSLSQLFDKNSLGQRSCYYTVIRLPNLNTKSLDVTKQLYSAQLICKLTGSAKINFVLL